MAYARASSVLERRAYKVLFDSQFSQYALYCEDPESPAPSFILSKGRWGKLRSISGEVEMEGLIKEINFYPDGSSTAGDWTLKSRVSKDINSYEISLDGIQGVARIEQKEKG